ncbi:hypothetical protein [Piscinibacter sp.]|jgi:hypothetical protein|uniref:hypothetical protein n=1 Tax=Piscinibacter sp. TaxID=1903157 RepID=UPI002F3F6F71
MNTATRILAIAFATLALAAGSAPAGTQAHHGGHGSGHSWHGHGHGHGHHRFHDRFWGVGIGIGLGWGYPGYPGYVVVESPSTAYDPLPTGPSPADPVFDPRSGQSAAQTEADRQDCNRWATTQPSAMAEAGAFHRAALACMEGRGYSVR